jgi:hypothetical protein
MSRGCRQILEAAQAKRRDGEYIKAVMGEIDRSCWLVIPTAVRSSRQQARLTTSLASSTSPVSLRTRART